MHDSATPGQGNQTSDLQAARQHTQETDQAPAVLELELQSDLARLNEVIAIQTVRISQHQELIRLWSTMDGDGEEIAAIPDPCLTTSRCFPNKSEYAAMQASGYLAPLPDETLRVSIACLFECEYGRQSSSIRRASRIAASASHEASASGCSLEHCSYPGQRAREADRPGSRAGVKNNRTGHKTEHYRSPPVTTARLSAGVSASPMTSQRSFRARSDPQGKRFGVTTKGTLQGQTAHRTQTCRGCLHRHRSVQ